MLLRIFFAASLLCAPAFAQEACETAPAARSSANSSHTASGVDDTAPCKDDKPTAKRLILGGQQTQLNWDESSQRFRVKAPPISSERERDHSEIFSPGESKAKSLLRAYVSRGSAAGLGQVFYDNRDGDHSRLPPQAFPGLTELRYSKSLREKKLHLGLANQFLFDRITIGNSSTAFKSGNYPRSLPRAAMTGLDGPRQAFQNYVSNQLYVYPEHLDHDKVDKFPANWPYMVISQGSSYSDMPFVRFLALTLAAMTPETQDYAFSQNLIAPTLQMILRRSQARIFSRQHYRSGLAHPVVFDKENLRAARAVALAQSLTPETLPPFAALTVEEESFVENAGLANLSEHLFTTPGAIARVWRGLEGEKKMRLSAKALGGKNINEVRFHWVLLSGDPELVNIKTSGAQHQDAEITLRWHAKRTQRTSLSPPSNRIDVGVFASTETQDSAPSFISVSFPNFQTREYSVKTSGLPQLESVHYGLGPDKRDIARQYDPVLFWKAPWTDSFVYDSDGQMAGWKRSYDTEHPDAHFDAIGEKQDGKITSYKARLPKKQNPIRILPTLQEVTLPEQ